MISNESLSILTCCPVVGPIVVVVPNEADTCVPLLISTLPVELTNTFDLPASSRPTVALVPNTATGFDASPSNTDSPADVIDT